jgi:hypothetical protein
MLQDEIMKLGDYFRGIEYFNDALIVKVNFPPRWQVYPSPDGNIKPAKSDKSVGEYYYYGDMNKVSLDDIFSIIKETIEANKDAELKIHLLNEKVNELKELFKRETYESLLKMKFVIEEEKEKKSKRKYTKKKKEVEKTEEKPIETVEGVSEEQIKIEENKD